MSGPLVVAGLIVLISMGCTIARAEIYLPQAITRGNAAIIGVLIGIGLCVAIVLLTDLTRVGKAEVSRPCVHDWEEFLYERGQYYRQCRKCGEKQVGV